ncbi:phosphomannomutase [Nitrincola tibetensis]|uniref:Phosphomannomutase n=1 Tax=Nitrincola tibetensis TaxID=2219697 RepID=A0A364NMA2_9GAMM|nr:phosphomannomutase [Nitrincola tibetensis]RAU18226.1 phosphomannomutase [Nitrincola tibetensis]
MTTQHTAQILEHSQINFGTSGARGLVEHFTDEVCAAFTVNFLTALQQQGHVVERLALGIDLRPSSQAMAAACAGAAKALGVAVDYYGVLPTPALALHAMEQACPAIMITGSHIPFDRNGLKFYRPDGEITKADEYLILTTNVALPAFTPERLEASSAAVNTYLQYLRSRFPDNVLKGWKIGVYEHSAAGRDITTALLRQLGAEVVSLGRSDIFVPIDTEAVSADDIARGKAWSQAHGFDAILSTDGDGDRPLVADETGQWLRGDLLGLICARYLQIEALAVPVSCNTAIETSSAFAEVMRTRIGSPYVIEAMQQLSERHSRVAGFEANGGFLLDALPTRDALLPALALFSSARESGISISKLVQQLPQRYTASDRITQVPTDKSLGLLQEWKANPDLAYDALQLSARIKTIDTTDGLRMMLANHEIVHLRPSGNAPELRCYVETDSAERSAILVEQVLGLIKERI